MKKSLTFAFLFFGVMIMAAIGHAQSGSLIETKAFTVRFAQITGSTQVRIWVEKPAGENFWITVRDKANYPVCVLNMHRKEMQRLFLLDMKEMADGKYVFEMRSGKIPIHGKMPFVTQTLVKEKATLAQPILGEQFVFLN